MPFLMCNAFDAHSDILFERRDQAEERAKLERVRLHYAHCRKNYILQPAISLVYGHSSEECREFHEKISVQEIHWGQQF